MRRFDRRSFLLQVAGTVLAGTAGARAEPTRRMAVDSDPSDPARPIRRARTAVAPPPAPRPVDSDAGANADAAGQGRAPRERFVVCPGHRRCRR